MFPVLPSKSTPTLEQLALDVASSAAALGRGFHPLILEEIARFMAKINSYYTNAMEGNPSRLKDIEAALNKKLSKDPLARNYQLEHLAHLRVQEAMFERLRLEPGLRVCSEAFLCWLHERFYLELPEAMRFAKTEGGDLVPVVPGELRDRGISVGRHDAPERRAEIRGFLAKFEEFLSPEALAGTRRLLGMAASHHRFLWIHPFSDGNGRVVRLFTSAYAARIGVGEGRLWSVTRAFARNRADYDGHLANADLPPRNSLDGRGPLSEEALADFCDFFLRACLEQIRYMDSALTLTELERRYRRYVDGLLGEKLVSRSGAKVLARLLTQGEVPRGEVAAICAVKTRRASIIIKELLDARAVRSETAYGALRLNITVDMAAALFPDLAQ
ncbi:MAG: Fic family protein [Elusimicrobia bacterium]|nr:Fic family protein [Elusimicrobiota bacterium]